jgi:8-oxo-dGTP diphosphatase
VTGSLTSPARPSLLSLVTYTYEYPRPAVTCDAVIFTMRGDDLAVLLIQRKGPPFRGKWALPGGFLNKNESLDRAAARELTEETGITGARLVQLGAYGDPGRDPRGHTVTIAYVAFMLSEPKISAGDDAAAAAWVPFHALSLEPDGARVSRAKKVAAPKRSARTSRGASGAEHGRYELAFDHAKILKHAHQRLCQYLEDPLRDRAFSVLPARFTMGELISIYELVFGRPFPPRKFKQMLVDRGLVVAASSKPTRKPAEQLYRWNRHR